MKSSLILLAACFLASASLVCCSSCENPQITSRSFTTLDATVVANIAYITEFEVLCKSGALSNLYADIEGAIVPISSIGPNTYQISWTEDTKLARRGDKSVPVFDEDGNSAVRKALRDGDELGAVEPLFRVSINHPGAFSGPWLKSEFVAVAVSVVIAYLAISSRSKLVS